ncbi:MAG: carbamoyltransferase [candidate division KSB1 bacterium]|jgi:carbamoyltransferase|nr:carbamoyltransferase [candidate division KSB1 bacterium]
MNGRPVNILGISAFYHDSAACLLRDGAIVAAAQEERFTRIKHDFSFPVNAIKFCLNSQGVSSDELALVAFYDKPFLKFERILETYLSTAPHGLRSFLKAMPLWIKQKLWIKDLIAQELQYKGKIIFPEHHHSHAASAFFPSPFDEAAFLTIDGVGEWTTTSYGIGRTNEIDILADIQFPNSLGLLYSAFTYYLGFRVNSGEYKLMGLAPYGEPAYRDIILRELIDVKADGSFRMNMRYFDYCSGLRMTNGRFHKLFGGPPRTPESEITQRHMDVARSIQEVLNEIVMRMAKHVRQETGQRRLCLAGGVALNCVANGLLHRSGIYDDIWIQPASGDAGGALGAALCGWYGYLGKERRVDRDRDSQHGSYLGPEYSDDEIRDFLTSHGIIYETLDENALVQRAADLIASGNVLGWFQGRMEFGPRALGARSILGDARSPDMQEVLNRKIKFRESFRPFAPAVLSERAADYFDLDGASPYMLLVAHVKDTKLTPANDTKEEIHGLDKLKIIRSEIPAVTHVDHSARLQTVHQETNPLFHALIRKFDEEQKCPVIINTSFNVRGEPIVCSPQDAYRCFTRTHMDFLIMGHYLIDKKQNSDNRIDTGEFETFEAN